jgi:hypothetical protein
MPGERPYEPADRAIGDGPIGLGREDFARRIADALVNRGASTARGVTLGVVGPWGSGKSTVLGAVGRDLEARGTLVVRFDPWLVSGRDDLVGAFLRELAATLDSVTAAGAGDVADHAKVVVRKIAEYGEALLKRGAVVGANILMPGAGEAVAGLVGEAAGAAAQATRAALSDPGRTLPRLREELIRGLSELGRPLVVLIDELDRIEDREVRAVAQLVKAVADFPQLSYLLAYDRERVIEALGGPVSEGGGPARGAAYLEKIVQYEIAMPVAFDEELRGLTVDGLEALAARDAVALPDPWRETPLLDEILRIAFSYDVLKTPRDVKRWIGHYAVLEPMTREEAHWADVLALSLLESKKPAVVEAMRRYPRYFVTDLAVQEAVVLTYESLEGEDAKSGSRLPGDILGALGTADERKGVLILLGWLFPVWRQASGMQWSAADAGHSDRLRNMLPYFAVLRRGLPPWGATRSEAEAALTEGWEVLGPHLAWPLAEGAFGRIASRAAARWVSEATTYPVEEKRWNSVLRLLAGIDTDRLSASFVLNEIVNDAAFGLASVYRRALAADRFETIAALRKTLGNTLGDPGSTVLLAFAAHVALATDAVVRAPDLTADLRTVDVAIALATEARRDFLRFFPWDFTPQDQEGPAFTPMRYACWTGWERYGDPSSWGPGAAWSDVSIGPDERIRLASLIAFLFYRGPGALVRKIEGDTEMLVEHGLGGRTGIQRLLSARGAGDSTIVDLDQLIAEQDGEDRVILADACATMASWVFGDVSPMSMEEAHPRLVGARPVWEPI